MFDFEGVKGIKKIYWRDLKPGMIIVGGVEINGMLPAELKDYPLLTNDLLNRLTKKYYFLLKRTVLVLDNDINQLNTIKKLPEKLLQTKKQITEINEFRKEIFGEKKKYGLIETIPTIKTDNIEKQALVYDKYNSFDVDYDEFKEEDIPSFFHEINLTYNLIDIVNNRLKNKLNIPEDKEVVLHLVVDYSYSMNHYSKLDMTLLAINYFCRHISEFLLNTKLKLYVFSDECRVVDFPLSGKEIERRNTNYVSFIKKVLHNKNRDIYNKLILFTDGNPSDFEDTLRMAEKIKKNKIDYTQIIFCFKEDGRNQIKGASETLDGFAIDSENKDLEELTLTDEELDKLNKEITEKFTEVAEVAGGNQIILKVNDLAKIISVECYDRYLGLLTLATKEQQEFIEKKNEEFFGNKGAKKWNFNKL